MSTEKKDQILVKVHMRGGSIYSYETAWDYAQKFMDEYRYFLTFRTIPPHEHKAHIEKMNGRKPYANFFFQRTEEMKMNSPITGELDGILDFVEIAAISIVNIPTGNPEKEYRESVLEMNKVVAESQKIIADLMKRESDEGNDWKGDK